MQYVYDKKYDTFCFQNCMNYILKTNGIKDSDLYINKSLSLLVDKKEGYILKYHFDEDCYNLVSSYSHKVQMFRSDKDSETVIEEVMNNDNSDIGIIMGVDSFELPYLPFYKKSHGLHSVVVKSVDFSNRTISISDCMSPWFFEGEVSLDDFLAARRSQNTSDGGMFSGIKINNIWKEISNKGYTASIEQLIKEQIDLTLQQFYYGEENSELAAGICALNYILDKMRDSRTVSEINQNELLESVHRIIYRYNHRRIFWTSFLDSIPEKLRSEILVEYQENYELLQGDWEKLLYKILMLKLRKKEKLWDDVINSFQYVIDEEIKLGIPLEEYARNVI